MTTEERSTLLKRAIATFGTRAQTDIAIEEMAELTKAICKTRRAQPGPELAAAIENVIEEIADVRIMLDQLCIIYEADPHEVEEAKLHRLAGRLKEVHHE